MSDAVVNVEYPYVYDLFYRVRNACLESEAYQIEFLDWVKAGIAYNTRSKQDPKRKISYFGELYRILQTKAENDAKQVIRDAVMNYYEDLFQLYQDHLRAQLKRVKERDKGSVVMADNLLLIPSFEKSMSFSVFMPVQHITISEYECENLKDLHDTLSTIYVAERSPLLRCMGMLFDYGVRRKENGVLLEVV